MTILRSDNLVGSTGYQGREIYTRQGTLRRRNYSERTVMNPTIGPKKPLPPPLPRLTYLAQKYAGSAQSGGHDIAEEDFQEIYRTNWKERARYSSSIAKKSFAKIVH